MLKIGFFIALIQKYLNINAKQNILEKFDPNLWE